MYNFIKSQYLIKILGLWIFCYCCFSCEEPVELNLEATMPQVVVNGTFSSDQPFRIVLSKTQDVLSNGPTVFINDATVTILNDQGTALQTLDFQKSITLPNYSLEHFKPKNEELYQLSIQIPGYPELAAKDIIPSPVPLKQLAVDTLLSQSGEAGNQLYTAGVMTTFMDPAKAANFYHLKLYYRPVEGRTSSPGFTENTDDQLVPITTIEPQQGNPPLLFDNEESGFLFTDEAFNGQLIQLKFYAQLDQAHTGKHPTIIGELRSVSTNYYQYYSSLARQKNNKDRPFAEPVAVFSNIENGVGIFAGFSTYQDSLTIVQ